MSHHHFSKVRVSQTLSNWTLTMLCRPVLDLSHSAIYKQFDSGDITAVVRGKEDDGFGDFIGSARPTKRCGGGRLGHELFALVVGHSQLVLIGGRDDRSWGDDVYADLPLTQID